MVQLNIDLPGVNIAGNQDTSGNASTASTLETTRTISLGGDLSGSVDFNGSQNVTITGTLGNSDTIIRSNLGLGASNNVEFNNVTVGGSLNSDDITIAQM